MHCRRHPECVKRQKMKERVPYETANMNQRQHIKKHGLAIQEKINKNIHNPTRYCTLHSVHL
jgi:hypothetical protein